MNEQPLPTSSSDEQRISQFSKFSPIIQIGINILKIIKDVPQIVIGLGFLAGVFVGAVKVVNDILYRDVLTQTSQISQIALPSNLPDAQVRFVAPSPSGSAVWGNSINGIFGINLESRTIDKFEIPGLDPNITTPIHYDGKYIWLTDNSQNTIILIDPVTLQEVERLPFVTPGVKLVAIEGTNSIIWLAFEDGHVEAYLSAPGNLSKICEQILVYNSPILLEPENDILWLAHKKGLYRIDIEAPQCHISLDYAKQLNNPFSMTLVEKIPWLISNGKLSKWSPDKQELEEFPLEGQNVIALWPVYNGLGLATDIGVIRFDTVTGTSTPPQKYTQGILSGFQNGAEWWLNSNTVIVIYINSAFDFPNLLDIAWIDNALYVLDSTKHLCKILVEELRKECHSIDIIDTPLRLIESYSTNKFWIGTVEGSVYPVNFEQNEPPKPIRLSEQAPVELLIDQQGKYLWAMSNDNRLFQAIDCTFSCINGKAVKEERLKSTLRPTSIAFDSNDLWFLDTNFGDLTLYTFDTVQRFERSGSPIELGHINGAKVMDFVATSQYFAVGAENQIILWDRVRKKQHILTVPSKSPHLAITDKEIWVADTISKSVYQIPLP